MKKDTHVPEGLTFLDLVSNQENACGAETDVLISQLGKKAPACLRQAGTVLSLLDRMASCWWGCRGGDHRLEYLCGRVASNARAAFRLLRFGFYDESLGICRGIGEVANLLQLFVSNVESLQCWRTCDPQQIRRNFGPADVRRKLESLGISPAIDKGRYSLLSERATHVNLRTIPQSHNFLGIPTAGARVQKEGIVVCLDELAISLSCATAFAARTVDIDSAMSKHIVSSSILLAKEIGGAHIKSIDDYHKHVLECLIDS